MTWSEPVRAWAALAVLLAYGALCARVVGGHLVRRRRAARTLADLATSAGDGAGCLVAHASQTGRAEELAWQTARSLATAGMPTRVAALSDLSLDALRQAGRVLFVVSTYGEGDPPDSAARFVQRVMASCAEGIALQGVQHATLALGDREYRHFCGFGRQLDAWLQAQGARPWFERIEVDNEDEAALARWRRQLGRIAGVDELAAWASSPCEPWTLHARKHLNPGSQGRPTYHVELKPPPGTELAWEAGDLVQIQVPGCEGQPRDYSIASVPADGAVHLLVRQTVRDDGDLGMASGWLTQGLEVGGLVTLRVRAHARFRAGVHLDRPMVLIGNGTGLAGLRAHLRARIQAGRHRNWLMFGERQACHDFYHRSELQGWQAEGSLRLSTVFSRDQEARRYVQDLIRQERVALRQWVHDDGAAVYVCGSLQGMASSVHEALDEVLGPAAMAELIEQGRYRRDVY